MEIDDRRVGRRNYMRSKHPIYIEQMDEKPEDYSQEDDAGFD